MTTGAPGKQEAGPMGGEGLARDTPQARPNVSAAQQRTISPPSDVTSVPAGGKSGDKAVGPSFINAVDNVKFKKNCFIPRFEKETDPQLRLRKPNCAMSWLPSPAAGGRHRRYRRMGRPALVLTGIVTPKRVVSSAAGLAGQIGQAAGHEGGRNVRRFSTTSGRVIVPRTRSWEGPIYRGLTLPRKRRRGCPRRSARPRRRCGLQERQ